MTTRPVGQFAKVLAVDPTLGPVAVTPLQIAEGTVDEGTMIRVFDAVLGPGLATPEQVVDAANGTYSPAVGPRTVVKVYDPILGAGFGTPLAVVEAGGGVDAGFSIVTDTGSALQANIFATSLAQDSAGNWYAAVMSSDRKPYVAKSTDNGATWTLGLVANTTIDNDAHCVVCIGIDTNDYIHCMYGMHEDPLLYKRSSSPSSVSSWVTLNSMIGTNEGDVTYPQLFKGPNTGILHCVYRGGVSSDGIIVINEYDTSSQTWSRIGIVFDGSASPKGPYAQNITFTGANDDIVITEMWRTAGAPPTNAGMNYAKWVRASDKWFELDGVTEFTLPITVATAEQIFTTTTRLYNQNTQCVDVNGTIHVAYPQDDTNLESQLFHTSITSGGTVTTTQVTDLGIANNGISFSNVSRPMIFIADTQGTGDCLNMLFTTAGATQNANFQAAPGQAYIVYSLDGLTGQEWSAVVPVTIDPQCCEFNIDYDLYASTGEVRFYGQTVAENAGPLYVFSRDQLMAQAATLVTHQPIYISNTDESGSTTDQTTFTFSTQAIGPEPGAGQTRSIVVGLWGPGASGAARTVSSVTINGITASQDIFLDAGGGRIAAFYRAVVPTGTSVTIVVTFSGQCVRCGIGVWRLTNIGSLVDSGSSTASPAGSVSVDAVAGGAVIGFAFGSDASVRRTATWTGINEMFDAAIETSHDTTGANKAILADGTVDVTCTWSAAPSNAAGLIVVSYAPLVS